MSAMVSSVSGISHGSVTISALTSVRSVMASALASQHADQGLFLADRLKIEPGDRLERRALGAARLLLAAAAPTDVGRLDAVFVLPHAAHPHPRGDLIFRQAA